MIFQYQDKQTAGTLLMGIDESELVRNPYSANTSDLLTIAWNNGPAQIVSVDGVEHKLEAGGVILLIYAHNYVFEQARNIVSWRFNRDFYCILTHDAEVGCAGLIFYGFPSPMQLQLNEEKQRKLDALHQVFVDEFTCQDNVQGEMLRLLLKRLIIILTRLAKVQHLKNPSKEADVDLIRQFNVLVEQNYTTKRQVADYAAMLHKSPKTLSNLFNKHSDQTPLQIIRSRIVLEAKRRLLYTDDPIGEIAYELGYTENAHFSRFFKQMEGVSPKVFREKR